MPEIRLRTFISPVKHRRGDALVDLEINGQKVCWLDSLLDGGVVIPEDVVSNEQAPLIWLISGPPGTGKTTFALELCYRLAMTRQVLREGQGSQIIRSVYFSAESPAKRVLANMAERGWDVAEVVGIGGGGNRPMTIMDKEGLEERDLKGFFRTKLGKVPAKSADEDKVRIVVLDSLNLLEDKAGAKEIVQATRGLAEKGVWLVLMIQDREHDANGAVPYYAFAADIETRLDEKERKDYLLSTFQIVKMRWQNHARGKHAMKVYPKPEAGKSDGSQDTPAMVHGGIDRTEGGVYVFPSIHRHLSGVRERVSSPRLSAIPVPVQGMEEIMPIGQTADGMLVTGFPKGRCTALVGARGALKSHLASCTLLQQLSNSSETLGLLLSLRDDRAAAMQTLAQIAKSEGCGGDLDTWSIGDSQRLGIIYFGPGYIPPEEFMHKIVVGVEGMLSQRGPASRRELLVVLHGIDHLAARHPLCAAESMFVPALISYLEQHSITSLVTAASDEPGTVAASGLLPMAAMVLEFDPVQPGTKPNACPDGAQQVVRVVAQRVPGGATSKGSGFLYRRPQEGGSLRFVLES